MRRLLMVVAIGAVSAMMAHNLAYANSLNEYRERVERTIDDISLVKKIKARMFEKSADDYNGETSKKEQEASPNYKSDGTEKIDGVDSTQVE